MKTSSKLQALCAEVKELDEKATPGPWQSVCGEIHAQGREIFCRENNVLMAHYRTSAVKLAKACEVMLRVFECQRDMGLSQIEKIVAEQALAEVEKILGSASSGEEK